MICGYGRVSSRGQSVDVQAERLLAAGCDPEHLYLEKRSGTTTARPELQRLLHFVRKEDVVLVTKLDRLARSTLDLCTIVRQLEQKQVELVVLDQHLDTSTPGGRLTFHLFAAVAQFETRLGRLTVLGRCLMLASRSPKCAHSWGLGQTIVRQA